MSSTWKLKNFAWLMTSVRVASVSVSGPDMSVFFV
jgi:hypothetical protein